MIEKKKATDRGLYLLFIDLTKAYDSVPWNKLWETLDRLTINKRLIEAIQSLYKGSSSKIKIGNIITKDFEVTKGLRQGCSLSPALFKIYLEQVLRNWKRKCQPMGIPIQNTTHSVFQMTRYYYHKIMMTWNICKKTKGRIWKMRTYHKLRKNQKCMSGRRKRNFKIWQ
jgi:hypothetical protein